MSLDPIRLAQEAAHSLRYRLQHIHALALARCRYEAHARGLSLRITQGGSVAVITDGTRQVWANARQSGAIWESICWFDGIFTSVRPRIVDGFPVVDISKPGEHALARSGKLYRFTCEPEAEQQTELYLDVARLSPGDVAIDGGAYCGGSTVAMSQAVGTKGRVLAFEPDPANFQAAQENLGRHGLSNTTLFQEGLWSSSTELEFTAGAGMLSSILQPGGRKDSRIPTTRIRVRSLEQIVHDERLERLDFVKLDIEGAEPDVLASSRAVLRAFRPRLVVEAETKNGRLVTPLLLKILSEEGYSCRVVMEAWDATWQVVCATPQPPS